MTTLDLRNRSAVLDSEHVGDIRGALGTIRLDDTAPRRGRSAVLKTLLAIVGPGLIVMVGDNDAGAFATYGQAGQNYGTKLLWTLLLLVPVLYVNQEMVLRLGAVTGVGHARLILERFGKFWGAFSVIDLFILNALTIVTEFIGITLAAGYLGRSEDRRGRDSPPRSWSARPSPAASAGSSGSRWRSAQAACCSSRCTSWLTRRSARWRVISSSRSCPAAPGSCPR